MAVFRYGWLSACIAHYASIQVSNRRISNQLSKHTVELTYGEVKQLGKHTLPEWPVLLPHVSRAVRVVANVHVHVIVNVSVSVPVVYVYVNAIVWDAKPPLCQPTIASGLADSFTPIHLLLLQYSYVMYKYTR